VEVTFTLDANGILNVTARELATGVAQSVQAKPSSGLTEEEVERMVRESVESAQEDMALRWLAETRMEAERVIRATERVLAEGPDVVPIAPEDAARIEEALEATRRAGAGEDLDAMRAAMQRLNALTEPVAHALLAAAARRLGEREGGAS
jgi:molecular chaperone DnaK (HSP70)